MLPHPQFIELYQGIESQNIDLLKTLLSKQEYLRHLDWNEGYLIQISLDDYKYDYYEPLLEKAVKIGNLEIVRLLLEKGRDLPYWWMCLGVSLEMAASLNNLELLQILLDGGADPKKSVKEPAIMHATAIGNIKMVQLLISAGACVNSVGEEGDTPLMAASRNGFIEIVKLLVEHGARVDATLVDGWHTALDSARDYGHEEICQYLESHMQ
jgi:ankyrin repeat protein